MSEPRVLNVVTTRNWVARELAANTRFPVVHSFGLDLPSVADLTASWWMPAEHAARLFVQGVPLALSAPGPTWLSDIPEKMRGRELLAFRVGELPGQDLGDGWWKPAEAKIEAFPAAWRTADELRAVIADAGLPDEAWVQWCPTRLDLDEEFRCYVLDGRCVAYSIYLVTDTDGRQTTYYDGASSDIGLGMEAAQFADDMARELERIGAQPSAYCLDIGWDRASSGWVVIEANPAWCSAWYGAEIDMVAEVIGRSCQPPADGDTTWAWRPDPYLLLRAAKMRPLPHRTS